MDRRDTFDRVAQAYDAFRPGYPEPLYECIVQYGRLRPSARVLEIGAGTGKATVPLARRGFSLLALEPGRNLAAIAREQLASFEGARVDCVRFEDWSAEPQAFDLACSAQAFHWLDPSTRLPKLAQALKPDGTLAIFGHSSTGSSSAMQAIQAAYRQHAPALVHREERSWYDAEDSPVLSELRASESFTDILFEVFPWQRALDAESYCSLLLTYSDHALLPSAQQSTLLDAIATAISAHGGQLVLDYRSGLFLARRRT